MPKKFGSQPLSFENYIQSILYTYEYNKIVNLEVYVSN